MTTKRILLAIAFLSTAAHTGRSQPVITSQPHDQTNLVGTTASFSVTATGIPPLSYQWDFGIPSVNLNAATNAAFAITNVQVANQGPYQVVISNVEGVVTSVVANLYITPPASLQFSMSSYTVAESAGAATLSVQRSGNPNTAVSVDYATSNGTATNGAKYTAVSGTLSFGPGETNKMIVVPILNEGFVEGTKYFRMTLSNPSVGAILGSRFTTLVSITDNDVGVQFQFATYSVAEDAGALMVEVVRGDDGNLPVTVVFATVDGTATAGSDYVGTSNTLAFAPQERIKLVAIPIINNTLKQPSRGFNIRLASAAGATLGAQTSATVTIVSTDQGFQFASATYRVTEDAGAALIVVLRGTHDTNSTFTVDYATSDGSATNGVDYIGITNTLVFGPGERVNQIAVPIVNNGIKQTTRNFGLALSNPTGGSVLGSPTSVIISILDNDPGVGFEHATYTSSWGQHVFAVTVLRGNDWFLGPITVDYTTANLSATAGREYQAVSGTLEFQSDETVKTINIPILQNRSGAKAFRVVLSNPTGGAKLGTSSTTVTLLGSYATVAPRVDTALTIVRQTGWSALTWTGGGQLQRADRPMGPWQSLSNATTPNTVQSPVSSTFYRVARPRPVNLYIPSNYDGHTAIPLMILLHGYNSSGADEETYWQIQPLAEARGFLYCYPNGTIDLLGNQFWNATDAVNGFGNTGVDDAGYLGGLIEEIEKQFIVDRKRVYLMGHSNGGFMGYRMACQFSSLVAGIASLAGGTYLDPSQCTPAEPVNILQIHGTADSIVPYDGGAVTTALGFPGNTPALPGALRDIQIWAAYNGASDPVTDAAPSLDLTTDVAGLDTVVTRYTNNPPGGSVELWAINGGTHSPTLSSQFSPLVIDWLLAHPKP